MLMMVVNDNLLEGEHGKLDVSNNSLSAHGGGILPYMAYKGICYWTGYMVFDLAVLNRVHNFV